MFTDYERINEEGDNKEITIKYYWIILFYFIYSLILQFETNANNMFSLVFWKNYWSFL